MHSETPIADGPKRAIVLGGGGFIGAACAAALSTAGFDTIRVGRSPPVAYLSPDQWRTCDLTQLSDPDWRELLSGADVIVSAAGALQDCGGDDLASIHFGLVRQLIANANETALVIQISAVGVTQDASTAFLRTKAEGDAVLRDSALDWVILRPGLVIGRATYGGSAMLRAAAAMPVVGVEMAGNSQVQTVALDDLAAAVVQAATGQIDSGTEADLVSPEMLSLSDVTRLMRGWLGFPPWRLMVSAGPSTMRLVAGVADMLAWFGWRSPLRSTGMKVLADGVTGDPSVWETAGGTPCRGLEQTLRAMPATVQDRWHAHAYLLAPLVFAVLSLFWIAAGLIGWWQEGAAMTVLTDAGWSDTAAKIAVRFGSFVDVALGVGMIWRRSARFALLGMILVTISYCFGASIWVPELWLDPLGPMVKTIPAAILALVVLPMLDKR
ncbi:MAG: SDR family oxidoreductase [Pikeienuella sp.]